MNCQQAQQQLRANVDFVARAPQGQLLAHLRQCERCRAEAEDQRLQAFLQTLPVAPASTGFAERALAQAWQQKDAASTTKAAAWRWPMAVAASLMVAVIGTGLFLREPSLRQTSPPGGDPVIVADATKVPAQQDQAREQAGADEQVLPTKTVAQSQVNVLLASGEHYPLATITVRIDDNLSLQGYAGRRVLQWQTSIAAGNNQLTLPLAISSNTGRGVVTLEIEANGVRKAATFTVAADDLIAVRTLAAHLRQPYLEEV